MTRPYRRTAAVVGAIVGTVLVLGAFGVFSALGVGRSASDICTDLRPEHDFVDEGSPLVGATRFWSPAVGVSCTWAEASDVRVVRPVFDHRATGTVIVGAAIVGISLRAGTRPRSPRP
ncbi:hypothetical protein M2284_002407 [Rhodococcus sp. LBL1]|nr:hypothetical protein [Rhodococcus sp. LBL1]MDH6683791.1 hypothetical protein [Rhodococcus sp. LBL2]